MLHLGGEVGRLAPVFVKKLTRTDGFAQFVFLHQRPEGGVGIDQAKIAVVPYVERLKGAAVAGIEV